jgi:homoserine kinase type II
VEQELARVLSAYGLGTLVAARRIERGHVDQNWMVETEQGRYFVKRRHPRRRQPAAVIRAQHDLITHLRRSGFPAPKLISTPAGQSFLVMDREVYEVGEYIEGELFDRERPEHLAAAAQMLGRYHRAVEGFAPPALVRQCPLYSPETAHAALTRLCETWRVGADPALSSGARALEAQANDLAERFGGHGPLPHLIVHGDYYAGNLLFDGDRIIGVVDYDKASWQPRVAELAEALIYFASPHPGQLRHLVYPGVLAWGPFAGFLQGYAQVIAPGDAEIAALPDFIACIWFTISLRRLLEHHPDCPPEASEALHEVLILSNWARVHARQMADIARAAAREEEQL